MSCLDEVLKVLPRLKILDLLIFDAADIIVVKVPAEGHHDLLSKTEVNVLEGALEAF